MASRAFNELRQAIALAEALARLEAAYVDPPRAAVGGEVESVQALRGGAVVLMVGAFEEFAKHAVEEYVTPLASRPPPRPFERLPEKMQVASAFKSIDFAMRGPRHGLPKGKLARLPDLRHAAEVLAGGRVDPTALGATDGNIDARNLCDLLIQLGIEDPLSKLRESFDREWGKLEASQFVRDKLDEIVLSRHRAAHAPSVLSISRAEISDGIRFLKALAVAVDELLAGYMASL